MATPLRPGRAAPVGADSRSSPMARRLCKHLVGSGVDIVVVSDAFAGAYDDLEGTGKPPKPVRRLSNVEFNFRRRLGPRLGHRGHRLMRGLASSTCRIRRLVRSRGCIDLPASCTLVSAI